MKAGKTLVDLAREIERQQATKRDFVASTETLKMVTAGPEGRAVELEVGKDHAFDVRDLAHGQIAEYTGIPKRYYDTMRTEAPDLLTTNVNRWFEKYGEPRMVRTLDGKARAFLSDKYRPLENADLAEVVLPVLADLKLEIMSCDITERRLYIKAVDERIKQDVPSGRKIGDGSHVFFDTCSPAIIISNSEVGYGQLTVEHGIFTKVCTNLATIADGGMRKTHVGGRHEITNDLQAMLTDETKRATDRAVWMQVRDVVRGAFDEMRFGGVVERMTGMAKDKIKGDPVKVVELTAKKFGIGDGERAGILRHLIEGGDLSRYGLFNAVTRTAEDLEDYDRASDFERLGGRIIELPQGEWKQMAIAA